MRSAMSNDNPAWKAQEYARKWLALAERRRDNLVELYRSGRWRRYYTEPQFLAAMRDVKADIEAWGTLISAAPPATPDALRKAG